MTGIPMGAQSGLFIENDSPEAVWSPSKKLEDAVARLQRDIAVYRQELRFSGGQGPANIPRSTKRSKFIPRQCPDIRANLIGNNIGRCLRPLCARMAGTVLRRHCSCFPS